ncbi:MAG: oxidoreductase [Chloroflexi bacterium]|nr:MAG: oxidoreductase [Chloroflexota bacterium]
MGDAAVSTFRALVIEKTDAGNIVEFRDLTLADLPDNDTLIDVRYSSLNYKDGLAITGTAPIARRSPMVAGADLVGVVLESAVPDWPAGTPVTVNGWGLSEVHWGGYTQRQRVRSEWLVRVPDAFTLEQAAAIGTAGYTAMLCVLALEEGGVTPESGDVLVTGASGGVGSVAVALLSSLGYRVVAATGSADAQAYLSGLGAAEFIERATLAEKGRPFQAERWAGVVDTVGSTTLANALAQTKYGGTVAACGLAGGNDLPTTVLPFILRGVRLQGVDSVMAPRARREAAWARLARDLDQAKLASITSVEPLSNIFDLAQAILRGETRGRVVIDVNR